MGHNNHDQAPGLVQPGELPGEARNPYADIDNHALIDLYLNSIYNSETLEGDQDAGIELGVRLYRCVKPNGDARTEPLLGRSGQIRGEDGRLLTVADYVNWAADHHFGDLGDILSILELEPGTDDYKEALDNAQGWFNIGHH